MSESSVEKPPKRWKRLLAKCWVYGAVLFITMAIIFSVFRALTPWARQYKPMVEAHLSKMLGQPVSVESMDTSWYWLHPVLRLNHVTLIDKHSQELALSKLLVGIDLLSSLWHWSIQPGILYIDHTRFVLHQTNDSWTVAGLNLSQQETHLDADAYLPILSWLSSQNKIVIRHLSCLIYLQNGSMIPLKHINLTIQNLGGRYRLKGRVQLNREPRTEMSVFADLSIDPLALKKTKGQVYLSIQSLLPGQWQRFLPTLPVKILDGKGNITIWLDLLKGRLSEGQSTFMFDHLTLKREGDPKPLKMTHVGAHVGAKVTKAGWEVDGNQVQLTMNAIKWPDNAFHVEYNDADQGYQMFVKHLLIQPLLAMHIPWPDALKPVIAMKPDGQLYDTAMHMKAQSVDYLLTGFSNLGWEDKGVIPAVSDLTGVLYWRPDEGRLQLDSYHTAITLRRLPPVVLSRLNTVVTWKQQSQGLHLSLEHVVLEHPDLSLTASAVMDGADQYPKSQVKLNARFVATHAEQWLKYIPESTLKPKLNQWLKHDIKRLAHVDGQVVVEGMMSNFPFDHAPGTFSVLSRLSGVDLIFARHWPLARDINAVLSVDKRQLNADIHHANLKGIIVNNLNLRLDDMGLDYETLLIHGQIKTAAEALLAYVMNTPLSAKLSRLKSLDLRGALGLDLKIEVPLYPENDTVLTQGEMTLDKNEATFHFGTMGITFDHIVGLLNFNEKGVAISTLEATMAGFPMSVQMQPIQKPKKALQIVLKGNTTMASLQQMFHVPFLALMNGPLNLDGILTLTDASDDLDSLQLQSSLQGVQVALPSPLGKKQESVAPLVVKMDFDGKTVMRLRVDYDKRLSTDLWYELTQKKSELSRGDILIGRGVASSPKENGLKISGQLPTFDDKKWKAAFAKIPADPSGPSLLDSVRWVDMTFGKLNVFNQQVTGVAIKAMQLAGHEWSLQIQHKDLSADVRYHPSTHTLSGQVERLHVDKTIDSSGQVSPESEKLSPIDVPNLQLSIQHLIYGDIDVGQVAINSKSSQTALDVTSCRIASSSYELALKGQWLKDNKVNRTDVTADLTFKPLSGMLTHWRIKPAIEANSGSVSFHGGWSGGPQNVSLLKVAGQLQVLLKGGRIKDLGSATEGKIGFGKVLSIFSLQTLPRRLKLDFSDLSQNGFSFDQFKGDFQLKNGVMNTQNSIMDGPVAYVSMSGDVDLVKQLFSLHVKVSPYVMASLPVVATIVGGPVAGIATWAASKILNQGMYKVAAYSYKVSGPWSDPVVEQSSIEKKQTRH